MSKKLSKGTKEQLSLYNRFLTTTQFGYYDYASRAFLNSIGVRLDIPILWIQYPETFFFTKKKSKALFVPLPFMWGTKQSYQVTPHTFPAFLRSWSLPIGPNNIREDFFNAINLRVREYPYTRRNTLYKNAFYLAPEIAQEIAQYVKVSRERNLYYFIDDFIDGFYSYDKRLYTPQYTAMMDSPLWFKSNSSISFMKELLQSIIDDPIENELKCAEIPADGLVFCQKRGRLWQGYYCVMTSSGCNTIAGPILPTKALTFANIPDTVPQNAVEWLYKITGGNIQLLEEFAKFLAKASRHTCNRQMSVLYSSQNSAALIDFICAILRPIISDDTYNSAHTPKSINAYCRISGVRSLFIGQETGHGVVFVSDRAVSDVAVPTFKKLLSGDSISVVHPKFPKQFLYNRNHLVCVSTNSTAAVRMSTKWKVPMLDFSRSEIPIQLSIDNLTEEDILWLRCILVPYGLLNPTSKIDSVQRSNAPPFWVEEFLLECCSPKSGELLSRQDLYSAYCACYAAKYSGKQPPLSCGQFTKAVKHSIGKGRYRNARYRKVRSDQKMYFDGIAWTKSTADICPEKEETPLERFNMHIEKIDKIREIWEQMSTGIVQLPGAVD